MEKSLLEILKKEREVVQDVNLYQETISDIKDGKLPYSALVKYEAKLKNAKIDLIACRKEIAIYLKNIKEL